MKPVAESSRAADTERFESMVGVWKPTTQKGKADISVGPTNLKPVASPVDLSTTYPQGHSNDHA